MANQKTDDTTLTDLRKSRGLTQKQVATAMGVNYQRIGQIEGAYPKVMLPVLLAYMRAIGGSVELVAEGITLVRADEVVASPSRAATVRYRRATTDYEKLRAVSSTSASGESPGGPETR